MIHEYGQYLIAAFALVSFLALLVCIVVLTLAGSRIPEQMWTMATIALGGVLGSSAVTAQATRRR